MYTFIVIIKIIASIIKLIVSFYLAIWNLILHGIQMILNHHKEKAIEDNNKKLRGVLDIPYMSNADAASECYKYNSIISGGCQGTRIKLLFEAIKAAKKENVPVIVLHESNRDLEQCITSISDSVVLNNSSRLYDPFYYKTTDEIIAMITDALGVKDATSIRIASVIKGMVECLRGAGIHPTLLALAQCPYDQLFDKAEKLFRLGRITQNQRDSIKSNVLNGQDQFGIVQRYLQSIAVEAASMLMPPNGSNCFDVSKLVSAGKIAAIDVKSKLNKQFIELLSLEMINQAQGYQPFCVIVDDISLTNDHPLLRKLINAKTLRCAVLISCEDLYSLVGSHDSEFSTVIGKSNTNIILNHSVAMSAQKWSESIGFYEKKEKTITHTDGKNVRTTHLFPDYSTSDAVAYHDKKEEIVKASEIQKLKDDEVYIFTKGNRKLIHTFLQ